MGGTSSGGSGCAGCWPTRVPPTPIRSCVAWAALGVARLAAEHGAGAEELSDGAVRRWTPSGRPATSPGSWRRAHVLGTLLISVGRHDEAREQAEAVLRLAARNGRTRDLAVAQNSLAWHEIRDG